MNALLKLIDPYRWLIAGVLVASVVGGVAWWRAGLIRKGHAEAIAEVNKQALKQIERALEQTETWKAKANEAQTKYSEAVAFAIASDERNADLLARMRKRTPSAQQLASVTPAACGEYAAETDRDFAACRVEYQAVGRIAAEASAAAWALKGAWPEYDSKPSRPTPPTPPNKP